MTDMIQPSYGDATETEDFRGVRSPPLPRHSRRLSDKVLIAFHHACDVNDLEAAEALLRVIEMILTRRPNSPLEGNRRRNMESLIAAHERLWYLRHPNQGDA